MRCRLAVPVLRGCAVATAVTADLERAAALAWSGEVRAESRGAAGADPKPVRAAAMTAMAAIVIAVRAGALRSQCEFARRQRSGRAACVEPCAGTGASSASCTAAASSPQKSDAANDGAPDPESASAVCFVVGCGVIGTVSCSVPSQVLAWPRGPGAVDAAGRSSPLIRPPFAPDSRSGPPIGTNSSSDSSHWRGRKWTTLLEWLEPFLPSGC